MSEGRKLPHDTVERRREPGPADHVRAPPIDPRRVSSSHDPNAPVTRSELLAFKQQVLHEVDEKLTGYAGGLDRRVRDVVKTEVELAIGPYKPGLAKLEQIAVDASEIRKAAEETKAYRIEREVREAVAKEEQAKREAEEREAKARADRAKVQADIELTHAHAKNVPVEAGIKYRAARLAVVTSLIAAVAGLAGAAIHSLAAAAH